MVDTRIRVQTWAPKNLHDGALEAIIGAAWPRVVGEVAEGRHRVLCVGPMDWIVGSSVSTPEALVHSLGALAADSALCLVDVSQALQVLRLQNAHARQVLSTGCGLDLHPRVFGAGRCARTRLAQVPVIVHCTNEQDFDCYLSRSYVAYLRSWLQDAALGFSDDREHDGRDRAPGATSPIPTDPYKDTGAEESICTRKNTAGEATHASHKAD